MGIEQIFADSGPVDELEFDEDLGQHLRERGVFDKHVVSFAEILEVFHGSPRFFANLSGRRAPIVMVGLTRGNRYLCIPIQPTGKRGTWRPVTAFTANTHHVERYHRGEPK